MADAFTNWINAQSEAAWDRLVNSYGAQPQEYKNAFFHAYSAALLTRFFGTAPTVFAGYGRELNTWGDYGFSDNALRDVFKDFYNNNIGTQITAELVRRGVNLTNTNALEEYVFDALVDGWIIVDLDDSRIPDDLSAHINRIFGEANGVASGAYDPNALPPLDQIPGVQNGDFDFLNVPAGYTPGQDELAATRVTTRSQGLGGSAGRMGCWRSIVMAMAP